jgi:hypothetical protein
MAKPSIPATIVRTLRELRDRTVPLYDANERMLAAHYRKGGWTARQVLVHISDVECVFLDRMRRLLAQDKALLMAMDPDGWADRLAYAKRDLGVAQSQFVAARSSIIELIEMYRGEAERFAIHSEQGRLTLADVVKKVEWHNRHHLEQAESALA